MDPITALVAIVQLIGLYRQEVGRRTDLSSEEFMNWLEAHQHDEIKKQISETFHLQDQVNVLLRDDHAKIQGQLEELSALTMALVKQFDSLAPIAESSPPEVRLPEQALSIIFSAVKGEARGIELMPMMGGVAPILIPSGVIGDVAEPQFLEEDCDLLCHLGYMTKGYSSKGHPRYTITRAGAEFGRSLPDDEAEQNQS
mgnify:CR=1 FL=1